MGLNIIICYKYYRHRYRSPCLSVDRSNDWTGQTANVASAKGNEFSSLIFISIDRIEMILAMVVFAILKSIDLHFYRFNKHIMILK